MISPSTIDKLNQLSLVDVVKAYVPDLKKKGASHTANCPFPNHDEKTPSFSVNEAKNVYKCYGCNRAGKSPISFAMHYTGLTFLEAVKDLACIMGESIEYENFDSDELKQKAEIKEDLYKINQAAARQFYLQLIDVHPTHPANQLLFDRWHKEPNDYENMLDLLFTWQLGYAPDSWDFISSAINEKALNEQTELLGLTRTKNKKTYDVYRNRLMFPIHDLQGRIVAFGGRTVTNEEPKYLNSTDSPIYNKSATLYGLYQAKESIQKAGFAYLTEGYTDVISFHLAELTNTVATCGTSLTEGQAKLLKRFTQNIVLAYDGDQAGTNAMLRAIDVLLPFGFTISMLQLPKGEDPDSFVRTGDISTIESITTDALLWKAALKLDNVTSPAERNTAFNDLARNLAMLDNSKKAMRSDYGRKIAKQYNLDWSTFRQMIDDQMTVNERKAEKQKRVRKNSTIKLNGNANDFPFFDVLTDKNGNYKDLRINKVKFVQLLSHFGFTRYSVSNDDEYNFVRLEENIIRSVKKEEIIDFVETFIENDYNFEASHVDEMVTPEDVKNKFYDGMRSYFSKDLFARMRLEEAIIINKDDRENTYFYYNNGFVTINKKGWTLQPYEKMSGSVWNDQMLDREFKDLSHIYNVQEEKGELDFQKMGVFADFVYRISGGYKSETIDDEKKQSEYFKRFYSLCTIIGYVVHDYYEYKLKAILLTDSSLSDESDGRTGKTLLGQLIGKIRSYCEINGKNYDANDKNKYSAAELGTQVLHLNDVKNKGRNKFDFEDVFNDVTEGYVVDKKFMQPFKNFSKMIISTNKTLHITGGSQRDRIIQFEVSDYFNENHSPLEEYGHWLMKEWDKDEWARFDNFMCYCAMLFHERGIIEPSTINLEMRVLKDHTCQEFIDFMNDINQCLKENNTPYAGYQMLQGADMFDSTVKYTMTNFEFEKKHLYLKFKEDYEDYKNANWFTQQTFTKWLKMYGKYILGVQKPLTRRSNGKDLIMFKSE